MLKSTAKTATPGLVLTAVLDDGELEAAVPKRVAPLLVPVAVDDVVDVDAPPCAAKKIHPSAKKESEREKHTRITKSSRTLYTTTSQE
jgi:hypothetical protein